MGWKRAGHDRVTHTHTYTQTITLQAKLQGYTLVAQMVKHLPTIRETQVQSLSQEDLLEKEMATHSSILAWKMPWTEEPGRLWSMGSQRVGHDWETSLSLSLIHLSNFHSPGFETNYLSDFSTVVNNMTRAVLPQWDFNICNSFRISDSFEAVSLNFANLMQLSFWCPYLNLHWHRTTLA